MERYIRIGELRQENVFRDLIMADPYRIAAEQPHYPLDKVVPLPSNYCGYSCVALHALSEYWSNYFRDMERKKILLDI